MKFQIATIAAMLPFTLANLPGVTGAGPWGSLATQYYTSGALSAFQSYTSAHPTGWNSADYSSFTSAYGPMPTGFGPGMGGPPGFGGPWGSGPGGWQAGLGCPFGPGGWGTLNQNGSWTTGAWTSWWGGNQCPPSTWSGWTTGSWSTSLPWTTWTACTASTTAASSYTTTLSGTPTVLTSFGYQVEQASSTGSSSPATATTGAGSQGKTVATGAMGAAAVAFLGVVMAL